MAIINGDNNPNNLSGSDANDAWRPRPSPGRAHDAQGLRRRLAELPVIPDTATRKRPSPFDATLYRRGAILERMFRRLNHRRRIATRSHKRADSFASAVPLADVLSWRS